MLRRKFTTRPQLSDFTLATEPHFSNSQTALIPTVHIKTIIIRLGLSAIITTVTQINKLDKQKSLNIGHISYYNEYRPITTTWPLSII